MFIYSKLRLFLIKNPLGFDRFMIIPLMVIAIIGINEVLLGVPNFETIDVKIGLKTWITNEKERRSIE
jgi:hypothetical protein